MSGATKMGDFERGFLSHEKCVCHMCKGVNRWVWVNPEPAVRFQRHRRKQEQAAWHLCLIETSSQRLKPDIWAWMKVTYYKDLSGWLKQEESHSTWVKMKLQGEEISKQKSVNLSEICNPQNAKVTSLFLSIYICIMINSILWWKDIFGVKKGHHLCDAKANFIAIYVSQIHN